MESCVTQRLVISAKNLGEFAYRDPCRRCLWVRLHVKKLPYQAFPGVFSSIDRYNKAVVSAFYKREGHAPQWLAQLGDVAENVTPPHYTRFSVEHAESGVTLRGEADAIFRLRDGSYVIADYKTARYTQGQEKMLPLYHAQLNGYAFIAERTDFRPVSRLALVYMEPVTDDAASEHPSTVDQRGFSLSLAATVVPLTLEHETLIPRLLELARAMFDTLACPPGKDGCDNCTALDRMLAALRGDDP
ncbi:MAG: hypothetical protein EXR48_03515 [Dehalococcoidia bacterium]|nr:hypothetical protein [Dehalococcoidia bacterium]